DPGRPATLRPARDARTRADAHRVGPRGPPAPREAGGGPRRPDTRIPPRDPAGRGAPAAARGAPRVQRGRGPVPGGHLGALLVRGVTLAEFVVATPRSRGRPLANRRQDGRDRWGRSRRRRVGNRVSAAAPRAHYESDQERDSHLHGCPLSSSLEWER